MFLATFTRAPLVVCAMTRTVSFCLAELWPRTNTHGSKILDFNACHILPPKYTLKPALIVQIHWDFTISAVHALLLKYKETLFWFHKCPQKFISPPQKTKNFIGQFMTADDSIKCQCAHSGMKSGRFQNSRVCLQAFPSFLPPPPPLPHSFTRTIFCTVFDSCSQFLAPKPNGNAFYAGSSLNHIFTQKFLKFSHRPPRCATNADCRLAGKQSKHCCRMFQQIPYA